ncbi:MAG: CHAT domain-containing protein [Leptolyngbyaceae cyanobacterium bins.302]|nr:CHAT domain-containing protein [Leptolyngbyaceae cyanobacterium bins.302]
MEIAVLTAFLAPFLPFLLRAGEKASEKAGEKFGEDAWNKAKAVWAKLHPKVEAKEDLKTAAEQVAAKPESDARKLFFQEELTTLLQADSELARAIAQIMQANASITSSGIQIEQMSGGTVAGNVQGSIFNISDTAITNLTGSGDIHYQEAPQLPDTSGKTQSQVVKTILVLATNPQGTHQLRLGEEVRRLEAALRRSQNRDDFQIKHCWAATPGDVRQALLDYKPYIVHFCGHGIGSETSEQTPVATRKFVALADATPEPEGLMFEDEMGQPKLVSTAAIANLFALFKDQIECVVLNACYSEAQAQVISDYIPHVVGMSRWIGDKAAIEFAIGFYDAIFAGETVKIAHQMGRTAIQMEGIPEDLTPVLHPKDH